MSSPYPRRHRGRVQAVILDWGGTTVDFGAMATAQALCHLFERFEVPVSIEETRQFMGLDKHEHISRLATAASVHRRWIERHGSGPAEADLKALCRQFDPLVRQALRDHAEPVPGAVRTLDRLAARGYRIGANTSCHRAWIEPLIDSGVLGPHRPQSLVCACQVQRGRPGPHMSLRNAIALDVDTVEACVKVDDTLPGIEEGLNAGMWTVAVAVSGNEVGLPRSEWQSLAEAQKEIRRDHAYRRLRMAGAHYVVDTIEDLLPCIDDIELRIRVGERP